MKFNTLKLVIVLFSIILFASCKSSKSGNKENASKRQSGGQPGVEQLIVQMDTNKDGKLSKNEVKGPLAEDFSKIDSNNDGFLSEKELKNAPKPNRQGPPKRKN